MKQCVKQVKITQGNKSKLYLHPVKKSSFVHGQLRFIKLWFQERANARSWL